MKNEIFKESFSRLGDILKRECTHGPVYYLANPGNRGDGLIRYATLQFFHDLNLNFIELKARKKDWLFPFIRGGTVIYGGGGSWCKAWPNGIKRIKRLSWRFKLIVLPSTFELSYTNPGAIFFCRDMAESKARIPGAIFCHDMAFYLDRVKVSTNGNKKNGYFFRTDRESAGVLKIPESNIDISRGGNQFSDVTFFFNKINEYSTVYTDRLHVAIAACLLDKKEIHFYPNCYFKNKAVYLSSMKDHFENITFHEDFDI